MGFFRKKIKMFDRIWMDEALKFNDILFLIRTTIEQNKTPLCIYHFHDSGKLFSAFFETQGLSVHKLQSLSELDTATQSGWTTQTDVILMDSDLINPASIKGVRSAEKSGIHFSIFLLERYPIPEPDDRVLAFINKRKDVEHPVAFVSLTEPWLVELMGDRVMTLMERLEIDKSEVIQHQMISSSLRKAQEKLATKVARDFPQDSLEAWLVSNLRT